MPLQDCETLKGEIRCVV